MAHPRRDFLFIGDKIFVGRADSNNENSLRFYTTFNDYKDSRDTLLCGGEDVVLEVWTGRDLILAPEDRYRWTMFSNHRFKNFWFSSVENFDDYSEFLYEYESAEDLIDYNVRNVFIQFDGIGMADRRPSFGLEEYKKYAQQS